MNHKLTTIQIDSKGKTAIFSRKGKAGLPFISRYQLSDKQARRLYDAVKNHTHHISKFGKLTVYVADVRVGSSTRIY